MLNPTLNERDVAEKAARITTGREALQDGCPIATLLHGIEGRSVIPLAAALAAIEVAP